MGLKSIVTLFVLALSIQGHAESSITQTKNLYVADFETDTMFRCAISSDSQGAPQACNATGGTFGSVTAGIAFSVADNGLTYGYVLDNGGQLFQCLLNKKELEQCNVIPAPNGGWSPIAMAFGPRNANGTSAQSVYVADNATNNVYQCLVTGTGQLSGCHATPSNAPGWFPSGMALAVVNHTPYLYVASNPSPNSYIYRCPINSDGTLGAFNTCLNATPTHVDASVWGPQAIAFATVNNKTKETQYAYVADSDGGNIYQCTLDTSGKSTNGTLLSCSATPAAGAPMWNPTGITFVTLAGQQYAYVADGRGSGLLYQCSVGHDGAFSDCHTTPNEAPWTGVFGSVIAPEASSSL